MTASDIASLPKGIRFHEHGSSSARSASPYRGFARQSADFEIVWRWRKPRRAPMFAFFTLWFGLIGSGCVALFLGGLEAVALFPLGMFLFGAYTFGPQIVQMLLTRTHITLRDGVITVRHRPVSRGLEQADVQGRTVRSIVMRSEPDPFYTNTPHIGQSVIAVLRTEHEVCLVRCMDTHAQAQFVQQTLSAALGLNSADESNE